MKVWWVTTIIRHRVATNVDCGRIRKQIPRTHILWSDCTNMLLSIFSIKRFEINRILFRFVVVVVCSHELFFQLAQHHELAAYLVPVLAGKDNICRFSV